MAKIKEQKGYENSRIIMSSYGMAQFFGQWITGPFGLFVFFFYEAEIGLNVVLCGTAFIIFSLWNAINDPLIGYLMERIKMPWEKRWGKRFPWILLISIPWLFSYLSIFLVPTNWYGTPQLVADNQWLIFAWFLITLCLYDTLYTLWNVNSNALYPDKFQNLDERRTATTIGTLIGMMGIVAGFIIPPMFVQNSFPETYRLAGWISVGLGMIFFLLMIPGVFEGPKLRARYQEYRMKAEELEREPFLKSVRRAVSDRRFMVKTIFFFGYQAGVALLQASAFYMVIFVLHEDSGFLSILMAFMLIGAFASVPLWGYFAHKVNNNKKLSLYAGLAMFITFLPIFFVNGIPFYLIALFLFGIGLGGQWAMDPPTMGDVLDDLAVRTGKRQAALYYGYTLFFIRLSGTFQALVFIVVHILTNFPAGVQTYGDLVSAVGADNVFWPLLGIRIHAALIPAIFVLITIFIFWKWYDLTPDKVAANQEKLKELGL